MRTRAFTAALAAAMLLVLGSGGPVTAQSIFGVNFLGEHQFPGSGRYRALGFSSYAVVDTANAVAANPAALADLGRVTFSLVEITSVANIRSGDIGAYENRFQLPFVMIGVPLRQGLVFSLGYQTSFSGKGDFTYEVPIEGGPKAYEDYRHRSGLFSVPFTLAWRPVPWARVAGVYNLERGSITDIYRVYFIGEYYANMESKRVRGFSGDSWSGSFLVSPHPRFSAAFGCNSGVDYGGDETFTYTRADLDSLAPWRFEIPFSWEAGAAFGINDNWWLSAHYWRRGAPEPRGFEQLSGSISDEELIAFGIEKRFAGTGIFFLRLPMRLGFYENTWHFQYPAGRPVKSRFVTFGTGFAMPGGPGEVDLSFEFGQIGSHSGNGVDERVFRLAIGLSASESWSRRKPAQ